MAPARAQASAMARPMPRAAPVTTIRFPSSIGGPEDDGGVLASERERAGEHVALAVAADAAGDVVEIAGGIGLLEVDRRMHPSTLEAQYRRHRLCRARRRDEVADHRLRGGDRDLARPG